MLVVKILNMFFIYKTWLNIYKESEKMFYNTNKKCLTYLKLNILIQIYITHNGKRFLAISMFKTN